jgi:signal transduction histidine kinase
MSKRFDRLVFPYLSDRTIVVWFAVVLIPLCGLTAAGVWYYQHQRERLKQDVWRNLNAIADLKVRQILEWRRLTVAEAKMLSDVPSLAASVERLLANDEAGGRLAVEMFSSFRKNSRAKRVTVVSREGYVVRSLPEGENQVEEVDRPLVERSLKERRIIFSDFNKGRDQDFHLELFIPLSLDRPGERREALAVLVLRLDPEEYLHPLIQAWPTPSRTAETLLVRRQGDSVVFLNELRHTKGSALTLSFPLEQLSLPASIAALDMETTMEGIDYRGVPVLAVTRKVPGSPWALVAKIDQAESYAAVKQMAKVTGLQVFLLVSTLCLALALLLAQKASRIRNREREAAERYQELAKHSDEQRRLTAHLDIREEESRRLSREIHEEFGNALVGARFSMMDLQGRIPDDHPDLADQVTSILADQKALIEQVRRISQHLRPPILDQLGLVPAIKWLADDFELRTGTKCHLVIKAHDEENREPYALAVYRICQEALSNVARHAEADWAQVAYCETGSEIVLEVADNGKGFNFETADTPSIGIISMRERAGCLGGSFTVTGSPGQGTKVTVRIPVTRGAVPVGEIAV